MPRSISYPDLGTLGTACTERRRTVGTYPKPRSSLLAILLVVVVVLVVGRFLVGISEISRRLLHSIDAPRHRIPADDENDDDDEEED
jgi:hypothetical protein